MLQGDLIVDFQYLKGDNKQDRDKLLTWTDHDRKKENSFVWRNEITEAS